ncbi:MAG: hypothetical protein H6978_12195, partial [Gammaproteobacteria bacterium]|nr:hypothetical protein [Gammaproteobacteria bacterium]
EENLLVHGGGIYPGLETFEAASIDKTFTFDHGLPGKVWASGAPQVLSKLNGSYFERCDEAAASGITAGLGIPIFAGDYLKAVVVFLCGEEDDKKGALEYWHCDGAADYDLSLASGCYGNLKDFEYLSHRTHFRKGFGLPGMAWAQNMPVLLSELGQSQKFARAQSAHEAGFVTGIALPIYHMDGQVNIIVMLSSLETPITHRMEVWAMSGDRKELRWHMGFSGTDSWQDEFQARTGQAVESGVLSEVARTGRPRIWRELFELSESAGTAPVERPCLAFPIIEAGRCRYVVKMVM